MAQLRKLEDQLKSQQQELKEASQKNNQLTALIAQEENSWSHPEADAVRAENKQLRETLAAHHNDLQNRKKFRMQITDQHEQS